MCWTPAVFALIGLFAGAPPGCPTRVGVLALGEGWRNNDHAFPTSARHGPAWWQIDVRCGVIRSLAWKVRRSAKRGLTARIA